ncbi:TonB-dependent receptor [Ravibacter arvi]|uniref:TonB-dependent receptor n=1 Tax=Ravibacter arvi TaxID=2051041 RepID=A0ABP8LZU0_9BACT
MRITLSYILLLTCTIQLLTASPGTSQELHQMTITISAQKESLRTVLKKIEEKTGLSFVVPVDEVETYTAISFPKMKRNIKTTLDILFENTHLGYRQINSRSVLIYVKNKNANASSSASPSTGLASNVSTEWSAPAVRGKVTDDKGESLPGVSVVIKGTQQGTITDENGNFQLSAPEGSVLVFSFVGYENQEVTFVGQTSLSISLKVDQRSLEEIVVVGYGTQKKTSVTAAVSTMKGEAIATVPVANMSNAIGGRLPGLIVRQNTGEPGRDASNIFIRGVATTGNSQPLLIVDNIPRSFQNLDPNTVESITVLKDAAAVAPYGVAGANGVILVTTKRGKSGTPTISYNGYIGFQNPTVLPELPTAYEYAKLKNEASLSVGGAPLYSEESLRKYRDGSDPDGHPNQNIYDMLFEKNTPLTGHNVELTGGAERVRYYASVGYQYQAGLWKPTNQSRYNYAISIDADVTKSTRVSFSLNGREQTNKAPTVATDRIFELVHYAAPNQPILFSNGESGVYVWNNVHGSGQARTNTTQVYSQLSLEQDLNFIKGLKLKGTLAFDPTLTRYKAFRTPSHMWTVDTTQTPYVFIDGIFEQTKPSLNQSMSYAKQLTYQASLNYIGSFGKNTIGALAVFEAKSNDYEDFAGIRRNYNLTIDELSMGSSSVLDIGNSGTSSAARQMGLVYRVTYDYADKYLFEASGRYDGSYYFPRETRFGFFPAFSVGWRLSEENFLKGTRWIDNLKLRASYGEVGALAGSPFQFMSLYNVRGPVAVLDGVAVQGAYEGTERNLNITWERARKTNIGLEGSFLNNLIKLEADYFFEHRANMLTNPTVVVPVEYGVGLSQVNAGEMQNSGIDLTLSTQRSFGKDFDVSLGTNFTFAKNKLIQVFETPVTYNNPNRRITGRPYNTRFGYESLGYFQVEDFNDKGDLLPGIATQPWGKVFPGDVRYKDVNSDGKIDVNDIVPIGVADVPQIIYGIFANARYKRFAVDLLFQGAAKTNIYGQNGYWHPFNNGRGAYKSNMDYWTPENRNASHARITPSPTSNNNQMSSYLMFNSRYLRLKNINVSYSIPENLSKKVGIQSARVYAAAQNLLTFTPIINYDPEIINSQALDYPQQRVVSFGLNLTF